MVHRSIFTMDDEIDLLRRIEKAQALAGDSHVRKCARTRTNMYMRARVYTYTRSGGKMKARKHASTYAVEHFC